MITIAEEISSKSVGKTALKVSFDYNQLVINTLKELNAIWLKKELIWELPCTKLSDLIDSLSSIDDIKLNILEDSSCTEELQLVCEHKTKMFDYQEDGVKWLINTDNGLLLDCPGLGKSLQVIYAAEELKVQRNLSHCLILCGINSLKSNWKKEIQKHSYLDSVIIGEKINSKGKVSYASIKERAEQLFNIINEFFIIINVESLRDSTIIDAIKNSKNEFDMIVFDEVHVAKNPTSNQGKNLLKLRSVGSRHYGLSGTLLVNSPLDAYVPLKFINNENSTYTNFKQFYCNYENKFGHQQIVGYKNVNILKGQIESCSLRRDKSMLNLPPKVVIPEYIEMTEEQLKFYEDLHSGILDDIDKVEINSSSLLGLVTRLRQASTCPSMISTKEIAVNKLDRTCELVDEIVSNGDKVVIFSSFKEPLYTLYKKLIKYNPLFGIGDLSDEEVSENIDKFQNNTENKVFLGTYSKASTGITLTSASYMIMIDSPWTNALFEQATDRIHRIGANSSVTIYTLINIGTIDERVYNLINQKKGISDYMIDNVYTDDENLRYLLGLDISLLS